MTGADALANELVAFLPVATAETLSRVLTYDDVETLRDLVRASVSENTIRAVASDLGYLEAWSRAATGEPLQWPPIEADGLKFIAHHLFRAEERKARRDADKDGYGMPRDVEYQLRQQGVLRGTLPHAPATVSRRLSSWRRIAQARGHEDALSSSVLRRALNAASKASSHQKKPKSETAITRNILDQMIGEGEGPQRRLLSLRELRDRTLLLVAFATGGRRRSELGALRIENIFDLDEGKARGIRIGRTKTTSAGDGEYLVVTGRAEAYLMAWLEALSRQEPPITEGAIFRRIDRWGRIGKFGLSGKAVNDIIKKAADRAGLDSDLISAHGLRSGYLTEASLQGVPIEAAMRHSMHRSVQTAVRYYHDQERASGKAAKLAG